MMRIDLKNTTFIIPVRLDSIIRLENLILTIDCIQNNFDTNITILEASSYCNGMIPSILKNVTYYFVEDKDPVFYRTKYINEMVRRTKTEIISIWDTDIIIEADQILDSVLQLQNDEYDVAYPYNGNFLDTSDILRNYYWRHRDIELFKRHKEKMFPLYSTKETGAVGGAFFVKTEKYIASGLENENFYGWGMEDGERYFRWLELGYSIYRNRKCLFHLSHPRDLNGGFRSIYHERKDINDFYETINLGQEELKKKISIEASRKSCIIVNEKHI